MTVTAIPPIRHHHLSRTTAHTTRPLLGDQDSEQPAIAPIAVVALASLLITFTLIAGITLLAINLVS